MRKKVFGVLGGFLVISVVLFFGFTSGGITGDSVNVYLRNPVVNGEILEGSLILDINNIPLDSVVEVNLGNQKIQKPISSFVDNNLFSVGEVKVKPEVVLTLKPVPRTVDSGSFKSYNRNSSSDSGGDEIVDLPEDPNTGNNTAGGNEVNGSSGIIGNVVLEGDNFNVFIDSDKSLTLDLNGGDFQLIDARSGNNSIPFDDINGVYDGDKLVVNTDYSLNVKGFVKKGNTLLDINLNKFGIVAEEGVLNIVVLYDGNVLSEESKTIKYLGETAKGDYLVSGEFKAIKKGSDCETPDVKVDRCVVDPISSDAFNDEITEGRVTKITYTDCSDNVVKVIKCSDKTKVRVKDVSDKKSEERKLDIQNPLNGNIVANVVYNQIENTLDVAFSQFANQEDGSCYNGVLDSDEEGIDCGGNCGNCVYEKKNNFWIFWILFGLIFVFAIWRSSKNESFIMNKLIKKGKRYLEKGDFVSAVRNYNELRDLYAEIPDEKLAKFREKSLNYYLILKKELSKKGIKVIYNRKKKGLPKLLYKENALENVRGHDDLSRIRKLVNDGIYELRFGKKKIAVENYNLIKGIYSNLEDKDKKKIIGVSLKLYFKLNGGKLLKKKIKKEVLKIGRLPKI